MAHDYEEIFDIEDLDDEELRRIVREMLRDNRSIDADDISVHVHDGKVVLAGRVGTDAEKRIAERIIEDRLGLENMESQLVVDPIRRGESSEAADEEEGANVGDESLVMRDRVYRNYDELQLLGPDTPGTEELDGTTESTESTELGIPWVPPSSQTPEGMNGPGVERDAESDSY